MSIATEGFRKRDRLARLTRVATLVYQHRPRGLTADEIAQRIDVNVRTAYRDLHAVQNELGIAMWQEHGRWMCDQASFLPPLKLTLLEAVTLFLSVRLLARHADKNNPLMIAAFGKLASVLPAPVAVYVHALGAAMTDGPPDRRYARVFEAVATAWATSHKLRISYSRMDASGKEVV